ncbi:MAG: HlyD family efflux transporter periplasmic adaptor subunit [Thermoanaerobaculia bacterium]|nr:HlyD family efflux transporter periplasmic adaptor subunit [Thermoanaerobaculia bacterium]
MRPKDIRLLFLLSAALFACSDHDDAYLTGTLERQRIELVASASEPLAELNVRPGDHVEGGQVLGRLDDRRVAARVAGAEARMRGAEARIAELLRGARSERREEMLARIEADRSELEQARLERQRMEGLVSSGVTPQSRLDEAETRVETATARIEQNRAQLDEMLSGATEEELRQATADLDASRAELMDLRVALERLTLRAPLAGRIDAVPYAVGELAGAGATLIVLLADERPYFRVYVPELDQAAASPGTAASVEADGLETPLAGCVRFVAREATFTPYYSLSEHDRHRLVFVTEIGVDADAVASLPTGLAVRATLHPERDRCSP